MANLVQIIPAILTKSSNEFEKMVHQIEPYTSRAHIDIADGIFVSNTTVKGIEELANTHTPLKIIVHLMVQGPEKIIDQWLNTSAEAFIFHIESTKKMDELISKTKAGGKKVGIGINPATPTEAIYPFVDKVDFVHFMTVDPGFYGNEFKAEVLDKIKSFRQKYPDIEIGVDGGINPATAKSVVEAGADVLVSGSFIFQSGNVGKAIVELQEAVQNF